MFLRPSYTPRGVNTAGAIASCRRLIISKFIRTGRLSDDMTTGTGIRSEQEAAIDKPRHTIVVVDNAGGNIHGVVVCRNSYPPSRGPCWRSSYSDGLHMSCRHIRSSCCCACRGTTTPGSRRAGSSTTPSSRRAGRPATSSSSCAGRHFALWDVLRG